MDLTSEQFEKLITDAIDSLPEAFARKLDNVAVVVELWPTPEELSASGVEPGMTLFGLYRGVPQTGRGNYTNAIPDKIIIFAGPMFAVYGNDVGALKRQVRITVLHEIGHHFGMNEKEIREAVQ
jgi:predicted Zn-dependent protease with MMP-like domain